MNETTTPETVTALAGRDSSVLLAQRKLPHEWDDDAICIHCGFDGAEDWWLNNQLRLEIGNDEFKARKEMGDFDAGRYCDVRTENALRER